jgi:hypothetical protein
MAAEHRALYARQITAMRRAVAGIQRRTAPVETVAAAVETALTADRPRARYVVGRDARIEVALRVALPTRVVDAALARLTTGT